MDSVATEGPVSSGRGLGKACHLLLRTGPWISGSRSSCWFPAETGPLEPRRAAAPASKQQGWRSLGWPHGVQAEVGLGAQDFLSYPLISALFSKDL